MNSSNVFNSLFRFTDSRTLTPCIFGPLPSPLRFDLKALIQDPLEDMFSQAKKADLLFLSGPVAHAQVPLLKKFYNSMLNPRWAIYLRNNIYDSPTFRSYSLVDNIEDIIPIDIELSEYPLTDAAVIQALKLLKQNILRKKIGR